MIPLKLNDPLKNDKIWKKKHGVTIYESARARFIQLLQSSGGKKIRITLEPTGCAGVSYQLDFDDEKEKDIKIDFGDGIEIVVSQEPRFPSNSDPNKFYSDWDFLHGIHIQFQESLMNSKFIMDNPNAQRGCSCGISFKPEDYGGKPVKCH